MLCLLEGQGVLGFINGEIQPPKRDVPLRRSVSLKRKNLENEHKVWRRTDRLVKGWILGSIGRDALDAVSKKETARDVWLELHKIFDQKKDGQSYSKTSFILVDRVSMCENLKYTNFILLLFHMGV